MAPRTNPDVRASSAATTRRSAINPDVPSLLVPPRGYGITSTEPRRQLAVLASVQLRPWSTADADALHEAVIDSEDLRTQFGRGDLSTLAGCVDVIQRQLAVSLPSVQNFAVTVDGRAVGNVGVSHMEHLHDTGWMHYWLAAEVRGHGLATQAVATVAAWAFAEQDLFRLELGHRVANPASCNVATRASFRAEGIERLKLKLGRQRFDIETHARLRTDPTPHVDLLPVRWASAY